MRFSATLVSLSAFTVLAAAMPGGHPTTTPPTTTTITVTAPPPAQTGNTCSTGPAQCCNEMTSSKSAQGTLLLGLLGVVLSGVEATLGLGCSPISVIGVGGGNCNQNVVCCQNNNVGGLISIGCIPIIL